MVDYNILHHLIHIYVLNTLLYIVFVCYIYFKKFDKCSFLNYKEHNSSKVKGLDLLKYIL